MISPRQPRSSAAKNESTGIIVLAAGASVRMNSPKQLLKFESKTLLRRVVETSIESICNPIVIVLGANFEILTQEIEDLSAEIVFNPDWQSGLSSSIKVGIENLLKIAPDIAASVITLADQPFVTTNHINLFVEKFYQSNDLIIAAEYNGTIGVPAIFAREVFDDFKQLLGDRGAKPIMEKRRERLSTIALPEAAFDVDTPQDFAKIKAETRA
jgi:molybdenum cofactor cytidylyltransferase